MSSFIPFCQSFFPHFIRLISIHCGRKRSRAENRRESNIQEGSTLCAKEEVNEQFIAFARVQTINFEMTTLLLPYHPSSFFFSVRIVVSIKWILFLPIVFPYIYGYRLWFALLPSYSMVTSCLSILLKKNSLLARTPNRLWQIFPFFF